MILNLFKQVRKQLGRQAIRHFSVSRQDYYKVTVVGANGGVGQPLALLLKLNPLISRLCLHDLKGTPGVAADLSHINTCTQVQAFVGPEKLAPALECAHVVLAAAGITQQPGMGSRDELLTQNSETMRVIATSVAKNCPDALFVVVTNPLNSLVPFTAEILKQNNAYDPKRLFGMTTLDVVRARAFIGQDMGVDPQSVKVHVIGGHSKNTIIPVLSNSCPEYTKDIKKLVQRIRLAGNEIFKAKEEKGASTVSAAQAAAHLTNSLLRGLKGEPNVYECLYVPSCITEARFFSSSVELSYDGIFMNRGLPKLNHYEQELMESAIPELKKHIQLGIDLANKK